MKQKHTTIQGKRRNLIKYIVQEDCTLDCTNFEAGKEIEIPEEPDNHWKGTDWFDQYPQLFEPVYDSPEPEAPTPLEVNEGKHTPGPWKGVTRPGIAANEYSYYGLNDKYIGMFSFSVGHHTDRKEWQAVGKANAELIASAPQLLADNEALKEETKKLFSSLDKMMETGVSVLSFKRAAEQQGIITHLQQSNRELLEGLKELTELVTLSDMAFAGQNVKAKLLISKHSKQTT